MKTRIMICALCVVILFFVGCSGGKEADGSRVEETQPTGSVQPVRLTLDSTIQFQGTSEKPAPQWGEDPVSRLLGDMAGVSVTLNRNSDDIVDSSLADVLIASGEFSDLIYVSTQEDITKLANADYASALDELAEEYCPTFWDAFDPMIPLNNQAQDGHVYALRKGYRDDRFYDDPDLPLAPPRMMALRTDWLEKLGGKLPQSVEELEGLLYRARDREKELGISVPLRLTGPLETPLADWMGLAQEPVWDQAAKKVCTPYRERGWLDYFRLLNRWYRDGVLGLPEGEEPWTAYITRTRDGAFATAYDNQKIYAAEVLFVLREGTQDHDTPFPYALLEEPLAYQGQIAPYAADHDAYATQVSVHTGAIMISKSSLQKEAAIRFLHFLAGEDTMEMVRWGIEGMHYERTEDGDIRYLPEYQYEDAWVFYTNPPKIRRAGIDYWLWIEDATVNGRLDASPEAYYTNRDRIALRTMEIRAGQRYKTYAAQDRNPVLAFAELSSGHGFYEASQRIERAWLVAAQEMVTAPSDEAVVQRWEAFQQQLIQEGIDQIEEAMTQRYQEALTRYQAAGFFLEG